MRSFYKSLGKTITATLATTLGALWATDTPLMSMVQSPSKQKHHTLTPVAGETWNNISTGPDVTGASGGTALKASGGSKTTTTGSINLVPHADYELFITTQAPMSSMSILDGSGTDGDSFYTAINDGDVDDYFFPGGTPLTARSWHRQFQQRPKHLSPRRCKNNVVDKIVLVYDADEDGEPAPTGSGPAETLMNILQPQVVGLSHEEINVGWYDIDDEMTYELQRKESSSSTWTTITAPGGLATDTTFYRDLGLAASTSYDYRLIANTNSSGTLTSEVVTAST